RRIIWAPVDCLPVAVARCWSKEAGRQSDCVRARESRLEMSATILVVFGTRPEAIKLAPVIAALQNRSGVRTIVCSTGQHREMLRQVTELFGIKCDIDLDVMKPNQSLAALTARLFATLSYVAEDGRPDWLLVQGATTSAFVAATGG